MRRMNRFGAIAAAGLLLSGCYGPFHLTRRLHTWNGTVGDKWVNECVFLVMSILPIYYAAGMADALIFNSIEFWTGNNPMAKGPQTRTIVRGDTEATMTFLPGEGSQHLIVQESTGGKSSQTLHLERRNGMTVARDQSGEVIFMATAQDNGGVLVRDAQGQQVASYSPDDVRKFYDSLPQ